MKLYLFPDLMILILRRQTAVVVLIEGRMEHLADEHDICRLAALLAEFIAHMHNLFSDRFLIDFTSKGGLFGSTLPSGTWP